MARSGEINESGRKRLARPFLFYHADRLHRRRMYVGVRRNDNLFRVAAHIRMNLLTNLWLKFIASKRHDWRGGREGGDTRVTRTLQQIPPHVIIANSSFFTDTHKHILLWNNLFFSTLARD